MRTRSDLGLEESASGGEGGRDCGVDGPGDESFAGTEVCSGDELDDVGPPAYSVPSS